VCACAAAGLVPSAFSMDVIVFVTTPFTDETVLWTPVVKPDLPVVAPRTTFNFGLFTAGSSGVRIDLFSTGWLVVSAGGVLLSGVPVSVVGAAVCVSATCCDSVGFGADVDDWPLGTCVDAMTCESGTGGGGWFGSVTGGPKMP
jgi:hypothetical protein